MGSPPIFQMFLEYPRLKLIKIDILKVFNIPGCLQYEAFATWVLHVFEQVREINKQKILRMA